MFLLLEKSSNLCPNALGPAECNSRISLRVRIAKKNCKLIFFNNYREQKIETLEENKKCSENVYSIMDNN